ncbi:ParB/RepB/Spo0J family partition protein [Streptomyces violascens]|uniref:ParB/RepB/Spo0J family partition protein n=1 Tax=Streptomyces violascens TaxID=67381 RepID=UPI00378E7E59
MSKADKLGKSSAFGAAPRSARSAAFARAVGAEPTDGVAALKLDEIADNPANPRGRIDPADEKYQGLLSSIRAIGVTSPISVCRASVFLKHHPQHEEAIGTCSYVVIAGHRRLKASGEAGRPTIPAQIDDTGAEDPLLWALAENGQHADLDPMQQAQALYELTAEPPHGKGYSQSKVARAIGKSQAHISQTLTLLNLHPDLQAALKRGELGARDARPIARIEDHEEQLAAYEQLLVARKEKEQAKKVRRQNMPATPTPTAPPAPTDHPPVGDDSGGRGGHPGEPASASGTYNPVMGDGAESPDEAAPEAAPPVPTVNPAMALAQPAPGPADATPVPGKSPVLQKPAVRVTADPHLPEPRLPALPVQSEQPAAGDTPLPSKTVVKMPWHDGRAAMEIVLRKLDDTQRQAAFGRYLELMGGVEGVAADLKAVASPEQLLELGKCLMEGR